MTQPTIDFIPVGKLASKIVDLAHSPDRDPPSLKALDTVEMSLFLARHLHELPLEKHKPGADHPFLVSNVLVQHFLTLSSYGVDGDMYHSFAASLPEQSPEKEIHG